MVNDFKDKMSVAKREPHHTTRSRYDIAGVENIPLIYTGLNNLVFEEQLYPQFVQYKIELIQE